MYGLLGGAVGAEILFLLEGTQTMVILLVLPAISTGLFWSFHLGLV